MKNIITHNELSVKQNMIWNSVGNFVYLFSQWVITYLVTRLLGFENAGIFSLAMSLGNTFFTISSYGMRHYQVSDINSVHSDNTYLVSRITTCVAAVIVCTIFSLFQDFSVFQKLCIVAYTVFKLSEAIVDAYHGIDQRVMRMDIIGKSFILRSIINTIVFVVSVLITKNLLISIMMMSVVAFIFIFTYDRKKAYKFFIHKKTRFSEIKKILIICFPLALFNFLFTLFVTVPRLFIEVHYGSEMLGVYASIALPAVIIQVFCTYIFTPFTTMFARMYNTHDTNGFKKLFIKIVFYITVIAVVAIAGSLVLGDFGLTLLFSNSIKEYTYLLLPIVIITILTAFSWFVSMVLIVVRNLKALTISAIISTIACVGFSDMFVVKFGLNGASFIAIVALVLQIIIMLVFLFISLKKFAKEKKVR